MIKPLIHLNGSGRQHLAEVHRNAYTALLAAIEQMEQAAPHGRDFYPLDNGTPHGPSYKQARDEHRQRLADLEKVADDLAQILQHVTDS